MHYIKRPLLFIVIFTLFLSLFGCSRKEIPNTAKIVPPTDYKMAISGKWLVEKYYNVNNDSLGDNTAKSQIGKTVYINKNKLVLLDKVCDSPEFKIKTVDSRSFLVSKYEINPESLEINQPEVQVITATYNDNYFASFIMTDNNTILTSIDGIFYVLTRKEKESAKPNKADMPFNPEVHDKVINSKKVLHASEVMKQFNSGLLVGLKSYKPIEIKDSSNQKNSNIKIPTYRTLWINFDNRSVKPTISELPYLLVPRKSGFWFIDSKHVASNNSINSQIMVHPLNKNIAQKSKESDIIIDGQTYTNGVDILFVGDDYISFELDGDSYYNKDTGHKHKLLRLYALDTINNKNSHPILISNLVGEQGIKSLKQGAAAYLNSLDFNDRQKFEQAPGYADFGIVRKTGKWILRGRLDSVTQTSKESFGDFDIPLIPSRDIVGYDSLFPSWSIIKQRVPEALDAYSSPNKNFVVVITKDKLLIYTIINNNLGANPLEVINLNDSETAVMSQWATGNYVKAWDEQMKKLKK